MSVDGYDIVGDIHGHADALHRLLDILGYREIDGVFHHPDRQMLFAGDFIDRGPHQREVLRIARSMCTAGTAQAVMGNHEFNAIGWMTASGDSFLRERSEKNAQQHAEFLRQIGAYSDDHTETIQWFKTLPIWLDLAGVRLIHACWHEPSQAALLPHLDEFNRFTEIGFRRANERGAAAHKAAEVLLKGPEQQLPPNISFVDKDGHERREVRLKWWDSAATTFQSAAIGLEGRERELPDSTLPVNYRYQDQKPVFFGHYWLRGKPSLTSANAACLDFSVAKEGYLTAYRWSGETKLSPNAIVSVPA
jgi:hypothetical protein